MTSSYFPDTLKSFSLAQPQQHHLNFQPPTTLNSKENTMLAIGLPPLSQRCQTCADKSLNTMGPISPPTIPRQRSQDSKAALYCLHLHTSNSLDVLACLSTDSLKGKAHFTMMSALPTCSALLIQFSI